MVVIIDISIDVIIIVFILAPIIIINIGLSDTLGSEFSIVRYGSNIFAIKGLYHKMIAIIKPIIVPIRKLIITSYVVIKMCWNKLFVLYRLIIVLIIRLGDEVIKVLIRL